MNASRTSMTGSLFDAMLALPRMLFQGVEALMGMAQGMMSPPGPPPPRPGPAAPAFSGPPAPAPAPPALSVAIVSAPLPAVALAVRRDADGAARGLEESGVKLVQYGIVSVRRGAERILPGGGGEVIVTGTMSAETFAIWIIARYLQSPEPQWAVPPEDRKYLRVSYKVLDRWDREPLHFEEKQLLVLDGIRRAIVDCCEGFPLPPRAALPPAPPAGPVVEVLPAAPAAAAALSGEAERVLAALKKLGAAGGATAQLVRRSRLTNTQVRRSLRELEAAGRIRRSGQGLQTRYHPVEE